MPEPDYADFFHRYADAYQRSLGDHVEAELIRSFFAESFLAVPLDGTSVQPGNNDESFSRTLEQGYAFYKSIGTRSMEAVAASATPIADNHDRVVVDYRASYQRKNGLELAIAFSITYRMQRRAGGPISSPFLPVTNWVSIASMAWSMRKVSRSSQQKSRRITPAASSVAHPKNQARFLL